jgi:hypothetical protein
MYDIDKKGIGKVMEEVQDYMSGRSIHLSYDIDSMDPFYAPSTGTAVRGGLTFREVNSPTLILLLSPPSLSTVRGTTFARRCMRLGTSPQWRWLKSIPC